MGPNVRSFCGGHRVFPRVSDFVLRSVDHELIFYRMDLLFDHRDQSYSHLGPEGQLGVKGSIPWYYMYM